MKATIKDDGKGVILQKSTSGDIKIGNSAEAGRLSDGAGKGNQEKE